MNVLQLIGEVHRQVPIGAPFGTRWKASSTVTTPQGSHVVAVAARIDAQGRRREQFWCDGVRVEPAVLLRLTCAETECPHAREVRAQWQAHHCPNATKPQLDPHGPRPLMMEIPVAIGQHRFVARPARFPCFTPCPHGAHPPMTIEKTGFDLFDEGACIGGGVVESGGVRQPRFPTVRAAEAFVLARHLETLAALAVASESSRPARGPNREAG
jgi:hypothetical protein